MLALGVLPAALAEDGQYGYVNFDNVRFRKQANDTVVWDKLNNGWVCKILGTKSAGGVNYYYVSTNLPAYLDREYYGYISQQYITLKSEAEADAWQKQGGNATVLGGSTSSSGDSGTDTANNVTALTNYARPNNASTNYYHYEGGVLTSLGLLSAGEAYYVTGTATINSTIYYIITVNGADCYVRGSNMTMLSSDTTTAPAAADAATQAALERLNTVIDRLIAPAGCPWDSTQTPESLTEYVIEECHELVDAIRSGKTADMVEELGDVAFLILLIGKLMARAGGPSLADALEVEAAKMVRRHPHVFSDTTYESQSEQLKDWDRIKREEKAAADAEGPKGTYDSLPRGLPPLTKAYRIHAKADRVGFTWPEDEDVEKQVEAEWLELLDAMASDDAEAIEHEFGDHMFTLVELGRRKGIKAAPALNAATERFLTRFERMEALARERNLDFVSLSLDDKDDLWNEVKAAEKPGTEKTED